MRVIRKGRLSLTVRPRGVLVLLAALAVALTVAIFTIGSGDYPMGFGRVLDTLFGYGTVTDTIVVNELRLPRVVAAITVGAALGLAGALFQSLSRNPLGSPDILGFTQGSAAGALIVIIVWGESGAMLAGGSITGAVATGVLLFAVAGRHGIHGYRLILTGIGLTAILTGINGYLLTRSSITDTARAVRWLTGSLDGREWTDVAPLAVALLVLVPVVLLSARSLAMLDLGDAASSSLGVRVDRVRATLLATAVLLVAFGAACAGPVAFVALVAPQLARRLTGTPGPNLMPALGVGAALLVCADWAAQHAVPGHLLPVGVVTGMLGGGYLVWLLATQRKMGRI